ncbi:hypothetical protein ABZ951_33685 [Streptomyces sp. NPDC046215]|uniref:hypothetical protein n=1 Tax=Streptomyces TaxID=1883 RepID=UPI0031E0F044
MSTEGGTPESTPDRTPDGTGRRKHPRLAVASVAAAVLLAGGGGAYWAATAGDGEGPKTAGPPGGDGSPPPLALDGHRAPGSSQGIAVGEPDPNGVRYRAAGKLPDGPRTAPVRLPRGEVSREEVASLAKALSVPGSPRLEQGVWRVGGAPGANEPTLQVSRKGPGNWAFSRYGTPGGAGCVEPSGAEKGLGKGQGPDPAAAVGCPQYRNGSGEGEGEPVSEEKARSVAAPVLKALGQDGAKTDARSLFGAVRAVQADPVVNGTPTHGWQTRLEVGADARVVSGGGQLQMPPKGAEYPLIGADEALAQLNRGQSPGEVSVGGCATAMPHGKDGTVPCPGKSASDEPSVVRSATFALASQFVGGRQALVPSWVFEVGQPGSDGKAGKGGTVPVTYPAVDPRFLAKPSAPSAAPSDGPASGGKSKPVQVDQYSEDGKKLVLHFWGGVCHSFAASAEQSGSAVTVKVTSTEKHPGRPCITVAKRFEETVTLDEPLDDRKVVDGTSGEPVAARQAK